MKARIKNAIPHTRVGTILYEENKTHLRKELFVTAGSSYDEVALLRLFEHVEINDLLVRNCFELSRYHARPGMVQVSLPLYADITRVITVQSQHIISLLRQHPERLIGRLYKQDMTSVILHLHTVKTISQDTLDKYFSIN